MMPTWARSRVERASKRARSSSESEEARPVLSSSYMRKQLSRSASVRMEKSKVSAVGWGVASFARWAFRVPTTRRQSRRLMVWALC